MTEIESKGRSPFFPDQPVPVELFKGRGKQIEHIMTRAVGQVALGKPVTVFLEGEYGVGKTSLARFTQWMADRDSSLLGIYATLERAESMEDVGAAILEAVWKTGVYNPKLAERIREGLASFLGNQNLFGVNLHFSAFKKEGSNVAQSLLPFLQQTFERVRGSGIRGIFLVMDEINGITANPRFPHFLKGIVDTNAAISFEKPSLPLLLMLCGVEERRRDLISHYEPVGRIFDVVSIEHMSDDEMKVFFVEAFDSVRMTVDSAALDILTYFSAGSPKVMHLIGNAAYWLDGDGLVDKEDASAAVVAAAEDFGKRYVNQQVLAELRSVDYHSILAKIAKRGPRAISFIKSEVANELTETEKRKFNNFLQKMKGLKVLRSGDVQGEYIFNVRMVLFYIWLQSTSRIPEPKEKRLQ